MFVLILSCTNRFSLKHDRLETAVHFNNRTYRLRQPLPPPPAPHYPQPRPLNNMYLTPTEASTSMYEEIQPQHTNHIFDLQHTDFNSCQGVTSTILQEEFGACGEAMELDNPKTPLVSAEEKAFAMSYESLDSMKGSPDVKADNIHNDYVDMNGQPVMLKDQGKKAEAKGECRPLVSDYSNINNTDICDIAYEERL